jgi:hypothetical protein
VAFFFLFLFDCGRQLPPDRRSGYFRWVVEWTVKGLVVPVLLWIVFDAGFFNCLPTFTPQVEYYRLAGHGFAALVYAAAIGLFFVGTYWAALTSGWLLVALGRRTEEQRQFKHCVLVWSAFLGPLAVLLTCSFGWRFAGVSGILWFVPIVQRVLCLAPAQVIRPIYSKAIAKLNFDKHDEAEAAVLEELEKCEDDFDGWLLLAELYARHFHDLPGAEEIIRQTCEHPGTNASQVAVAFHRLADWHLELAGDPAAARRDLWEICRRHPKSHLDHMARLRLEHVPSSREELIESRTPKAISLPPRLEGATLVTLSREEALARAKHCVEELKKNPDNAAQREDLARLFAEQLDAVDRGLEQLDLLLAMPNLTEAKAAQWLALMAAWQLKYKQDQTSARKLLERIVRLYPKTPQAFAAQTRLSLMDAEARMRSRLKSAQTYPAQQ